MDDSAISTKTPETLDTDYNDTTCETILDAGPQSLPAVLTSPSTPIDNKFEQSGIFITDDVITVDVANTTGLRKTGYSTKIFGGEEPATTKEQQHEAEQSNVTSKIPRSPLATRRRSFDNTNCSGSLQDLNSRTGVPVFNRKKPVYRSVRKPSDIAGSTQRKPAAVAATAVRDVTNTWSGRTAATGGGVKKRPTINSDTFSGPSPVATPIKSSSASSSPSHAFERNVKTRSSQILYDSNGRRIKGCTTASLTTSPVKNYTTSPLAQQLLEAASSAKNDAQILEKMKTLLSRYSSSSSAKNGTTPNSTTTKPNSTKKTGGGAVYEDFTSAWVHSNGTLERSSSCSPPTKTLSKRSSAASSTESTHSRDVSSVIVSPRRERGMSKIPGPIRQHTELY